MGTKRQCSIHDHITWLPWVSVWRYKIETRATVSLGTTKPVTLVIVPARPCTRPDTSPAQCTVSVLELARIICKVSQCPGWTTLNALLCLIVKALVGTFNMGRALLWPSLGTAKSLPALFCIKTGHWISAPANEVMCDKRSASNKRMTLSTLSTTQIQSQVEGSSKLLPTWWEPWSLLITSVFTNIIFNIQLSITLLLLWSTSDDLFLSDTVYKKDESSLTPDIIPPCTLLSFILEPGLCLLTRFLFMAQSCYMAALYTTQHNICICVT